MRTNGMMIDRYFDTPRSRVIASALLLGLFVLLYIATLGMRPLFIPDETRYGEIAREMLATGDWIVPRLNGLLYFEKPPFGYWLNAISLSIFGETPFAVRFSNTLATAAAAAITFVASKCFFRSSAIPYLAVFVFLTTLEVQAIGNFSVLDPVFAAVLNGGILSMALGAYSERRKRKWLLVLAGILFGLAFLTKGFLAFALPALVLTPWLLIRRDYDFLLRHAWITVTVALLIIAPWAFAIHAREADFWNYFFWVEHIQRFASDNAQHKEPFYYFLLYLPALAFPWVFLLPVAVKNLRGPGAPVATNDALLLLSLWAIVPFVFFSIANGKLSTYILPCFVPFSIILAAGISSITSTTKRYRGSLYWAAIAVLIFLVVLIIVVDKEENIEFASGEWPKQLALYGSLLIAAVTLGLAALAHRPTVKLALVGMATIPFMIALPQSMPESILGSKAPEGFLKSTYNEMPAGTVIVTNGSLVRAVSWSTKRTDIFVIENGGETTYGLNAPDGTGRFLESSQLRQLICTNPNVLVVCKGQCGVATLAALPENAGQSSYGNFYSYAMLAKNGPPPSIETTTCP